ncbi:MAG: hypothetical protein ACP5US_11315 [Candidatus Kryptoniota bacterium]
MKHAFVIIALLIAAAPIGSARILKVGQGQTYASIQDAINAASAGDTVKVLPGSYNEAITINKSIVVQGSGYETTKITSTNDPTVIITNGKIMWFAITSVSGDGVQSTGGLITNCVIAGCPKNGLTFMQNSTGTVKNCVLIGNGGYGAYGWASWNQYGNAINCISWGNGRYGFEGLNSVTYCDGSIDANNSSNNINSDPRFKSGTDYHLLPTSQCYQAGNPVETNPDGSRADMGYFGGVDCPVYPVVTKIVILPAGNGQVQIQATAQANY